MREDLGDHDEQLKEAMTRVGANRLQAPLDPPALRKYAARVDVDLASIAPAYAVDLIVDQLAEAGIENAMVELGCEICAVGNRRA